MSTKSSHLNPQINTANYYSALASSYDRFAGTCIRTVCTHIISSLPPLSPNTCALDNACGTGLLTTELLKVHPKVHIDAVDIASGMLSQLHAKVRANAWEGHVEPAVMDGNNLQFPDETFDLSFTIFGLFFFAEGGTKHIYRTLKTGGTAIVTTWKQLDWLSVLREVQKIIKPGEEPASIPLLDKWAEKETLEGTLTQGGFNDVKVSSYDSLVTGSDLEDLVDLLKEAMERIKKPDWNAGEMRKLPDAIREVLLTQRERFLVQEESGRIGIRMIAWIATAKK
ncbi:hypothetical protein MMC06_006208 [Schaereria dolodes]|nr:hypothetical protein [Schaereria dolodes]